MICSSPPGICDQKDFDHDWKLVMSRLDHDTQFDLIGLLYLATTKKYKIKEIETWPDFME